VKVNINFFAGDIGSLENDFTGIGGFKHVKAAEESGFAAAGRSDDGDNFSGSYVFVNAFEYLEVSEAFIKIDGLNHLLLSLLS
jgi:hypothetical protein